MMPVRMFSPSGMPAAIEPLSNRKNVAVGIDDRCRDVELIFLDDAGPCFGVKVEAAGVTSTCRLPLGSDAMLIPVRDHARTDVPSACATTAVGLPSLASTSARAWPRHAAFTSLAARDPL